MKKTVLLLLALLLLGTACQASQPDSTQGAAAGSSAPAAPGSVPVAGPTAQQLEAATSIAELEDKCTLDVYPSNASPADFSDEDAILCQFVQNAPGIPENSLPKTIVLYGAQNGGGSFTCSFNPRATGNTLTYGNDNPYLQDLELIIYPKGTSLSALQPKESIVCQWADVGKFGAAHRTIPQTVRLYGVDSEATEYVCVLESINDASPAMMQEDESWMRLPPEEGDEQQK